MNPAADTNKWSTVDREAAGLGLAVVLCSTRANVQVAVRSHCGSALVFGRSNFAQCEPIIYRTRDNDGNIPTDPSRGHAADRLAMVTRRDARRNPSNDNITTTEPDFFDSNSALCSLCEHFFWF
jgi:hypothetical protein